MKAKIHSFESFGTVDGPGIRFVVFFKGCPMRCRYCHNPDTWDISQATEYETDDIASRVMKYKSYYTGGGGVTLSGGEPLMQIDAATELLKNLKSKGIHTCIDTCGYMFNPNDEQSVAKHKELIKYTDLFLLDIKQINKEKHIDLTRVKNDNTLAFAKFLSDNNKDMWIRYVLVPGYSDDEQDIINLKSFIDTLSTVKKIEVLPYHSLGVVKYEKLGLEYSLKDVKPPSGESVLKTKELLGVIGK